MTHPVNFLERSCDRRRFTADGRTSECAR